MEHLRKRLKQGDTDAFVALYDRLNEPLLKYLSARLNPIDAKDVLQEVFSRVVRYHRRLAAAKQIDAYVFQTARNETNRWLTKTNRRQPSLPNNEIDRLGQRCDNIEDKLERHEYAQKLLEQLTPESREVVELKIFASLPFNEISSVLNIPEQTAASRYRRAISKLKSWIQDNDSTCEFDSTT